MTITPIQTEADYKAALKTIESLMSAEANTPDGDRLDVLVTFVQEYERTRFAMDIRESAATFPRSS